MMRSCSNCLECSLQLTDLHLFCSRCGKGVHIKCASLDIETLKNIEKHNNMHYFCKLCNIAKPPKTCNPQETAAGSSSRMEAEDTAKSVLPDSAMVWLPIPNAEKNKNANTAAPPPSAKKLLPIIVKVEPSEVENPTPNVSHKADNKENNLTRYVDVEKANKAPPSTSQSRPPVEVKIRFVQTMKVAAKIGPITPRTTVSSNNRPNTGKPQNHPTSSKSFPSVSPGNVINERPSVSRKRASNDTNSFQTNSGKKARRPKVRPIESLLLAPPTPFFASVSWIELTDPNLTVLFGSNFDFLEVLRARTLNYRLRFYFNMVWIPAPKDTGNRVESYLDVVWIPVLKGRCTEPMTLENLAREAQTRLRTILGYNTDEPQPLSTYMEFSRIATKLAKDIKSGKQLGNCTREVAEMSPKDAVVVLMAYWETYGAMLTTPDYIM